MKRIQFLAASDRLNYGDLLFPLITKQVLEEQISCNFQNYALVRSNLSKFGALPTKNYRELEKDNTEHSIIIIGGGHVIFPSWNALYGHISSTYLKTKKVLLLNYFYSFFNIPRRFFTKSKTPSPFAPYHLKGRLVYLSVGGNYNSYRSNKNIIGMLANTSILSVRDNMLFDQLNNAGYSVDKVPDTATIISKIYHKKELKTKLSSAFSFDINHKFIIVQLGLYKGPIEVKKFIADINILKEKGYRVVCMPIGLAADHEDDKVLQSLLKIEPSWNYYRPNNIYEIMYLINFASYFFGTSLHGCITAFAYNTPFIPLNKKVKKLNNYTKTWWSEFIKESIDYSSLGDYIKKDLKNWDSVKAERILERNQKLVFNTYMKLIRILD